MPSGAPWVQIRHKGYHRYSATYESKSILSAWKLDIEYDVNQNYRDDREPENVEPTPILAA
jgi:hypothetical protein